MGLSNFDEKVPLLSVTEVHDTDTPGSFNILNATALASRVDNLLVSTDDTADVVVEVFVRDFFSNSFQIAVVNVPAGSGFTAGVPACDLLAALPVTMVGIVVGTSNSIVLNLPNALTAGKQARLAAYGGLI